MSNNKIGFIINPIAGSGKQKFIGEKLSKIFSRNSYEIIFTTSQKKPDTIVSETYNDFNSFVAVGGDGTVNETAKKLINTNKAFGIIPLGSGNGIARHFKIPMSTTHALKCIMNNNVQLIDTGSVNEKKFIGFVGIGFDALVAQKFSNSKSRGLFTYIKVIINSYFNYAEQYYNLIIDGKPKDIRALAIIFSNTNQFGNGAKMAPKADASDGLLDITIIKKPKLLNIPKLVYQLFTNSFHENKNVNHLFAQKIEVKNKVNFVNLDGEAIQLNDQLKININPLSLQLITP